MYESLRIGIAGWILAEGVYPPFQCGEVCSFALTFSATTELKACPLGSTAAASLTPIDGGLHHATGKVQFAQPGCWGLNTGVDMYACTHPPGSPGDMVSGEIDLQVDSMSLFDRASLRDDAPGLRT